MACSPHYLVDGKIPPNSERDRAYRKFYNKIVPTQVCDEKCIYYEECLVELNGGNKRIAPLGIHTEHGEDCE